MDMRTGIRRAGLGAVAAGALMSLVSGSIWAYQAVGAGGPPPPGGDRPTKPVAPVSRPDSTTGLLVTDGLAGVASADPTSVWAVPGPAAGSPRTSGRLVATDVYRIPDGPWGRAVLVKLGPSRPRWILTNAETTVALLEALQVRLASTDRVRPSGAVPLVHGMSLQVVRIRMRRVTRLEEVPYQTVTTYSDSMALGEVTVLHEGIPGRALRTYSVTYRNGREVRRQLLSETVVSEPVSRILERGTSYTPPSVSGGAAAAVAAAYSVLGVPYVNGGASPSTGFDCSGLTMWAWAQGGVSLPHSASAQYYATRRVSRSDLQPGDLLFFYSGITHVAIYVGGGQMIMAHKTGTYVQLDALSSYWWGVYQGAGRPG